MISDDAACLLCESPQPYSESLRSKDFLHSGEEFQIVRCLTCGLLRTHPKVPEERIGGYYAKTYGPYQDTQIDVSLIARARRYIRLWQDDGESRDILRQMTEAGARRILEVGPGANALATVLKRHGLEVTAVEMDANCAARLRRNGIVCHTGTLKSAARALADKRFDAVIMRHVFEHLYAPIDSLRQVASLLTDTGVLYMTLPDASSIEAFWFGSYWFGWELPRHVAHYEPETVRKTLMKSGFKLASLTPDYYSTSFIESLELVLFGEPAPSWIHMPLYYLWKLWRPAHFWLFGSGIMRIKAQKISPPTN